MGIVQQQPQYLFPLKNDGWGDIVAQRIIINIFGGNHAITIGVVNRIAIQFYPSMVFSFRVNNSCPMNQK